MGKVFRQVGGKPQGLLEATARRAVKVRRITNAASPETTRHLSVQGELALRRSGNAIALPLIQGDDPQAVRRQRPLQLERRSGISLKPRIKLGRLGEDHRHRFGVHRSDDVVGRRRQEPIQRVLAIDGVFLRSTDAAPGAPDTREGEQRPVFSQREPRPALSPTTSASFPSVTDAIRVEYLRGRAERCRERARDVSTEDLRLQYEQMAPRTAGRLVMR
jgi:hypothetical protein